MLANTVRAVCAVPVVTTFLVGAIVLTSLGWWLLSVLVLDGAPDPRKRVQSMAKKNSSATVDVDSLDFSQPESTRGRKSASPDVCQISRYVAKNSAKGTIGVLKVKIGDTWLADLDLSLGTRAKPVKIKVEAAFSDGKLYIRQCDDGGWSLSKAHNSMRAPTFGSVTFTGDLPARVFAFTGSALNGSSVEVEAAISAGGKLLVLTLPTGD